MPTATWLLFIVLLNTLAIPATAVSYTPIQRATAIWLARPVHFGPPPRPTPHLYMPQFSWQDHLRWARTLDNSHTPKALDPTLVWCVKTATAFHPITEFHRQAVEEIRQLVEDMEDVTDTWRSQLPPHVHHAYTTAGGTTQVPVFIHLLKQIRYLTQGFRLMRDLQPGTNWILLLCPTMHYVDDYGSTEITKHSSSGFQAFEDFNGALGYRMKPSKRQPPAQTHKIQGVNITIEPQHIVLTPCPQRVERMCQDILTCLNTNHLDPDMARRMAGKCNFLTGRLFGKVGRAPLKAIYARAHSHQTSLDKPTKAALYALMDIISHCRLMRIPREPQARHFPIIYTDAYYTADRQCLRPSDPIPEGWQPRDYATVDNGFGAVIFPSGESDRAWFFQGRLPKEILKQFSSNTAFIYLLEAWVALLAPLVFEPLLGDFHIQCCDNEAARHAIIKGVGKHQPLNALISAHWTWHNRRGIAHRLERVPTKANISDPISRFEELPHGPLWSQINVPHKAITNRALKLIGDIRVASTLGFENIPELGHLQLALKGQ